MNAVHSKHSVPASLLNSYQEVESALALIVFV